MYNQGLATGIQNYYKHYIIITGWNLKFKYAVKWRLNNLSKVCHLYTNIMLFIGFTYQHKYSNITQYRWSSCSKYHASSIYPNPIIIITTLNWSVIIFNTTLRYSGFKLNIPCVSLILDKEIHIRENALFILIVIIKVYSSWFEL